MAGWSFYVFGDPAPQGSKRHVGRGVMIESSKRVVPWREAVKAAAPAVERALDGPLSVSMVFTLQRPGSTRKMDRVPYRTPDLSKLCRATEDAITEAGLWADDARVAQYVPLAKVWTTCDIQALPVPGVVVAAVEMDTTATRMHWSQLLDELALHAVEQAWERARTPA